MSNSISKGRLSSGQGASSYNLFSYQAAMQLPEQHQELSARKHAEPSTAVRICRQGEQVSYLHMGLEEHYVVW